MEQSKEEFENSVGEPEKVVSYTLIKIMFKKKWNITFAKLTD